MEQEGANARALQGALATRYGGDMQAQGRVDNAVYGALELDETAKNDGDLQRARLAAALQQAREQEAGQTRRTAMSLQGQLATAQLSANTQKVLAAGQRDLDLMRMRAQEKMEGARTDLQRRQVLNESLRGADKVIADMAEAGVFGPSGTPEASVEMNRAAAAMRASVYESLGMAPPRQATETRRPASAPAGPNMGITRE